LFCLRRGGSIALPEQKDVPQEELERRSDLIKEVGRDREGGG
jgi:hypothetical protein